MRHVFVILWAGVKQLGHLLAHNYCGHLLGKEVLGNPLNE